MNAWTVPGPWHAILLVLASYRLCRLLGWDEWPPAARLRAWLIGEIWVPDPQMQEKIEAVSTDLLAAIGRGELAHVEDGELVRSPVELPGKQASSPVSDVQPTYRRPLLAHLVRCPFCLGWWISLSIYIGWLAAPRATLYAMTPFAIAGAVGLLAKNLDP